MKKHIQKTNMKILSKLKNKGRELKEKKLMSLKMKMYKRIEKYRQGYPPSSFEGARTEVVCVYRGREREREGERELG